MILFDTTFFDTHTVYKIVSNIIYWKGTGIVVDPHHFDMDTDSTYHPGAQCCGSLTESETFVSDPQHADADLQH